VTGRRFNARLLTLSRQLGPALLLALVVAPLRFGHATAFGIYPAGTSGMDVSYPSCEATLPASPTSFAIIGVSGGRAFYQNPCLIKEFVWAQSAGAAPSLFMNLNAPSGSLAFKGNTGPRGTCVQTDALCISYNFGYNDARLAYADAQSQETSATMWWLDVEEENTWSDDKTANAQVVQGAIDYLRSQGRTLGVYSTAKQWGELLGSFSPGLPNWVAGAPDSDTAPSYCDASHAFGGGTVWLVQYPSGDFDADYACGAAPVSPATPTGFQATAVDATSIQLTWTAPPAPVDSYVIWNGVSILTTVAPPATSYTVSGLAPRSYHCFAIASQKGGVYSSWSSYACMTTPSS
jgi:hypothetical protein